MVIFTLFLHGNARFDKKADYFDNTTVKFYAKGVLSNEH